MPEHTSPRGERPEGCKDRGPREPRWKSRRHDTRVRWGFWIEMQRALGPKWKAFCSSEHCKHIHCFQHASKPNENVKLFLRHRTCTCTTSKHISINFILQTPQVDYLFRLQEWLLASDSFLPPQHLRISILPCVMCCSKETNSDS